MAVSGESHNFSWLIGQRIGCSLHVHVHIAACPAGLWDMFIATPTLVLYVSVVEPLTLYTL